MGIGGISIWKFLIILLIVIMLFGTKRLKGLGADIGDTIKGFRKSMESDDKSAVEVPAEPAIDALSRTLEDSAKKN
ncbi:twin-arginine translocase TatA/TatE family subunit [Pseudomonas sp. N-137]|jgi:sec-independent protein translocase protein TatA|uniref:twin-arginine translocase TatA/TatE family subunit n=1 Tax=unclassified Pseudomonas TaxID=196821 RepID=UPI002364096B|nr:MULTISPECIES: twin-arginine translocase TatA/TatE family subunit [unclassified Pseudomonas]MDD2033910.1 twin-arginine translocase TatA/TatE family subunit [Pseudomonas sp. 39167]MEA1030847.1 twin-arginine translocase TatA/TatE family subunit [Pseudomonas sp. N-137]